MASLTSVAKLPFTYAKDGISYTFSIVPAALGKAPSAQENTWWACWTATSTTRRRWRGTASQRQCAEPGKLLDAIEHPEQYPNLTIRVSGYAVRFNALTREQQQDVISERSPVNSERPPGHRRAFNGLSCYHLHITATNNHHC
ncbi:2-ketobutyrate formate-lyase / Pyruvate formate-lyase [Klebsiella pneumoniae]|nr:2-ketobutyrate formate-lyase / Pyruvate formate-lyase [Klebsiella pneumoniae]